MRLVVADTSPLVYLILIEQVDILPQLFESVIIPNAVRAELLHRLPKAPKLAASGTDLHRRESARWLHLWLQSPKNTNDFVLYLVRRGGLVLAAGVGNTHVIDLAQPIETRETRKSGNPVGLGTGMGTLE